MFIDSHAHIYADQFNDDIDEVLEECKKNGVEQIYMPNIDSTSIAPMLKISDKTQMCKPMMGIHPCHIKSNYREELKIVEKELSKDIYAGVGEIGIDLYWDKTLEKEQRAAFEYQINLAKDHNLPVIIHSRDALDDTIAMIEQNQNGNLKGIFHCFNGTVDQGKRIVDVGFYLGIGGVITFKNAGVDKSVAELPLSSMVLETDAPYLSPTPYRGKRNSPQYIPIIAQKLSDLLSETIEKVADVTSSNCKEIFAY